MEKVLKRSVNQASRVWKVYFQIHWMVHDLELAPDNVWDLATALWDVYGEPGTQPYLIWR